MSQKDLQFIERALERPWMFWVYFWKWPRIVRQACAEYDLLSKERDAAKDAHEQALRANRIVQDWIYTTHKLDMTADLRAIWTAGKRLSVLLLFLWVAMPLNAQLPPILRQYFTTNAHVLSSGAGVLTNNGVGTPGTLGWKSLSDFAGIGDLVWTNNATHIWPAGSGVSGTAVGAPIAIRYDGSLFIGTNAAQDIGSAFTSGDTFMRPMHTVSYINSNGATRMTIYGAVADDQNYSYYSDVLFRFDGSQSIPISRMEFNAVGTNASLTARTRLFLDPAFGGSGTQFSITEDSADRIALQPNVVDGSSAVAFLLNTRRSLTNTGSKLFSLQNTNVEKVHVKYNGAIYSATLTPSTVLWANSSTNISSIANGAGALTNDGAGALGWFNGYAPATGGKYIATNAGTGWNTSFLQPSATSKAVTVTQVAGSLTNTMEILGAASAVGPFGTNFLAIGAGIITNDSHLIDMTANWSNSAVTFTGMKMNVTDTASGASSKFIDLLAGGTSAAIITKSGSIRAADALTTGLAAEIYTTGANALSRTVAARTAMFYTDLFMNSGFALKWSANASGGGDAFAATDTSIARVSAAKISIGNATGGNIAGIVVTSNITLAGSCTVTQALANGVTAVALTADNQSVSATNRSYIQLSSDDGTAGNRTFVLSAGTIVGQVLDLEWTGTNAGEIVDDFSATGGGNGRLSATWTPTQYDVLGLRWNGTDWIERYRSAN